MGEVEDGVEVLTVEAIESRRPDGGDRRRVGGTTARRNGRQSMEGKRFGGDAAADQRIEGE